MVGRSQRSPLQTLSKLAFGHEHRLTIARAFLARRAELVDKASLVTATQVSETTVYNELISLTELGAIRETADGNRIWYSLLEGPFWKWASELLATVPEQEVLQKDTNLLSWKLRREGPEYSEPE